MLVTILPQKYRTGCEKGITDEVSDGILKKLNSIIEWDKCEFPHNQDDTEDRKFLGDTPELKPGNCFVYEGNVITVDRPDRLILIVSETGPGALHRICEEIVKVEYDLINNCSDVESIEYKEVNPKTIPDDFTEVPVSFYLMKIFREKVAFGRFNSNICLECNVDYFVPLKVYIRNWSMFFDLNELEEDMTRIVEKEIIAWFYKNHDRILPPKPAKQPTE